MRISTGIIDPDATEDELRDELAKRCQVRRLKPDWSTLTIASPREGVQVATVEASP